MFKERRHTAIRKVQKQWYDYQANSNSGASDINSISARSSNKSLVLFLLYKLYICINKGEILSPIQNRHDNYDEVTSNNDIYEIQSNESSSNNNNNKYRPGSSQSDYYNRIPRPKSRNSQRSESAQSSQTLLNENASYNNSKINNNNNSNSKFVIPGGNNRRIISAASDDSHLVEIEGETTLYFYGPKSLEEIDNQLNNNTTTSTIVTISFNYIEFNHIVKYFIKLRNKFSNLNVNFIKIFFFFLEIKN
jgi:hypothetical protein